MSLPDIGVMYGDRARTMVKRLLYKFATEKRLQWEEAVVGIKPNLVLPSPAEEGATTDPEIIAGIIEYISELGVKEIKILESSWVGAETKRAFQVCGYEELAREFGVQLVDLKEDNVLSKKYKDREYKVCSTVLDVDILVNVPVLKAHCQTKMTCALKNIKGCIPDVEKRRFHRQGLHRPIADINQIVRSDLIVVDGLYGDLTFEEGGNPVKMARVITGVDPAVIDCYAAQLLGLNPEEISYIKYFTQDRTAHRKSFDFSLDGKTVFEYNAPRESFSPENKLSSLVEKIDKKHIKSKAACSACYGNLVQALYRLKNENSSFLPDDFVYIGQGFSGESRNVLGVGNCTSNFSRTIPGCPPAAHKIVKYLKEKK